MRDDEARTPTAALTGIALFVAAVFFITLASGWSKLLAADLPAVVIVWGRYVVFLLLVLPAAISLHGRALLRPPRRGLQILRGVMITASSLCVVAALAGAPVAEVTTIIFIYPFILAALAPPLFGERHTRSGWLAIIAGFAGVLLVIRPSIDSIDRYSLFALMAGLAIGGHMLSTRGIGVAAPAVVTATFTAIIGTAITTILLPLAWDLPTWEQIGLIFAVGVAVTVSQIFTIMACGRAEMSTLAPFSFAEIIFALGVGYVLFGDNPDAVAWIGIAIVIASGLHIAISKSGRRLPLLSRSRPPAGP